MKNLWLKTAACAALLSLAACGSGPSDDEIATAIVAAVDQGGGPGHSDKPPIKDSKCSKSGDDAWECDFAWGPAAHHGRFAKLGGAWKLVGSLG